MSVREGRESEHRGTTWRSAAVGLAVLIGTLGVLFRCLQPPAVIESDAPLSEFSAERAFAALTRVLADEAPHPIGTHENALVRGRLVAELEALGLRPDVTAHWIEVQRERRTEIARPVNVTAVLPTLHPERPAIVLACHYDSVAAGPGAADDGAGMAAILEVARALLQQGPLPQPVVLLFTDGEELGLYGARSFVRFDPLAKNIGIVLNLEARGTAGGSLFFESSRDNRWIVSQAGRGLRRPMSSSAYVTVYQEFMPNSSDLAIFLNHRLPGMNFAFIDIKRQYHTPLDNLRNLDRRSLQHHGDNALGMVNTLLASDWDHATQSRGDAVYTDLFAHWIIAWPASITPYFAGLICFVLILTFIMAWHGHAWRFSQFCRTVATWLAMMVGGAGTATLGLILLVTTGAAPTMFPAEIEQEVLFLCLLAALGSFLVALAFRPPPTLLAFVHGLFLAAAALALSLTYPGFSYLWLLPAAMAALLSGFLIRREAPFWLGLACCAVLFVTLVIWYSLIVRLPLALGLIVAPGLGLIIATLVLPLAPLFHRTHRNFNAVVLLALIGLTSFALSSALQSPAFTKLEPQQINLVVTAEEGQSDALLSIIDYDESTPPALTESLEPVSDESSPVPLRGPSFRTPSPALPAPETTAPVSEIEAGVITSRFKIRPANPSQHILLGIPARIELRSVAINEVPLRAPVEAERGHRWFVIRGSADFHSIEMAFLESEPFEVVLAGMDFGLPATLTELGTTRDRLPACPAHLGDLTTTYRRLTLP